MKKLHLLMFAAAGLLAPSVADAEITRITTAKVLPSPVNDLAPVSGNPTKRLRRTNEEQPGAEDPYFTVNSDGKTGMYYVMATELNGVGATHRMQAAAIPFTLKQDATGAVVAEADLTKAKFITNNRGNEYRNANKIEAHTVFDNLSLVMYNYQPEGTNDTVRYAQVLDTATGAVLQTQKAIMAKNNDDCAMMENGLQLISQSATEARFAAYWGCNGNGRDDGWAGVIKVTKNGNQVSVAKEFDLSVEPQEERSRGDCSVGASDPNTMFCTWTAGNNQPQRNGTWLGAIDVTPGKFQGANQQGALLWKMQIGGRKQIEGKTTYSMRATHQRILLPDAGGKLVASDMIAWRSGDLTGNNNTNGKGGRYYANQVAVMKVTRAGMTYVTPMKDIAPLIVGTDGTHLNMEFGVFGQTGALQPGWVFHEGSHTGGGTMSQARVVTWDQSTSTFKDAGMFAAASHDRHLYPNYLGNNPGNQGRNHSAAKLIANPYAGVNSNQDAYIMLIAGTGKDPAEKDLPQKKLSAFLTVVPVAQNPAPTQPPAPQPQPSGQTPTDDTQDDTTGDDTTGGSESSDQALGGCSTSGSGAGFLSLLLVGLAAFIRRRR